MNLYEADSDDVTHAMTTRQALMRLRVSRSTLFRWCKKGVLQPMPRCYRRSKLFKWDDIMKLVESAKK